MHNTELYRKQLKNTYYVCTNEALYVITKKIDQKGWFVATTGDQLNRIPFEQVSIVTAETPGEGLTWFQVPNTFIQTSGTQTHRSSSPIGAKLRHTRTTEPAGQHWYIDDPVVVWSEIKAAMREATMRAENQSCEAC